MVLNAGIVADSQAHRFILTNMHVDTASGHNGWKSGASAVGSAE